MARKRLTNVRRRRSDDPEREYIARRGDWLRWGDYLTKQSANERARKLNRRGMQTRIVPVNIGLPAFQGGGNRWGHRVEYRI